jgi:hypothetical protein
MMEEQEKEIGAVDRVRYGEAGVHLYPDATWDKPRTLQEWLSVATRECFLSRLSCDAIG